MLLVVLWLLIGTRSRLLVVRLLSIAEPLCPSWCFFGTISVTLCLMVWDWRVSRAEPMLSCWHDLLFLFCLLLFYLFLPSTGWLCLVGVFGLIECSHSLPALHCGLQLIIIMTCTKISIKVVCPRPRFVVNSNLIKFVQFIIVKYRFLNAFQCTENLISLDKNPCT